MTAEICRKCGKEKSIRTSLTHDIIYACSVFDRKLYRIEYYKKNKDKIAEYQAEYRKKNKDKIAENKAEYYKKNKDKIAEYYKKNKDKIAENKAEYYKKNKDKIAEYYKKNKDKKAEYGKKIKKKVMNFYSSGEMRCRDCKEDILELLTIEHINGGGVKQRKEMRSHNIYKWLIKENFPPGYAVLCIRCNWLKGKVSKERYEEILQEIKQRDAIMIKA